ncbi:response regulator [Bacteroidota bacterium]
MIVKNKNTKWKVLVVDDIPMNLQVIGSILFEKDVDVYFASNGEQAIETVDTIMPDLIVLDVAMPKMDGYEVIRVLKKNTDTKDIPVIFLTAKTEQSDINRGLELGAVDYITKPFNSQELLARVFTHLDLKRSKETIRRQIAELKENINLLELAKAEAEKANESKTAFLSNMSHELRTPMNAIIGIIHLLIERNPKGDQIESLEKLKQSSEYLLSLIGDILEYNEINSETIIIEKAKINLEKLVLDLYESYKPLAEEKGLDFVIDKDEEIPKIVLGDEKRLIQILSNLIRNAIKFTEKGKVKLIVKRKGITETHAELYFAVEDTGIGIKEEKQEEVFKVFTQQEEGSTRKYGGAGMGLAIVKKLLHLKKSSIHLESTWGKGSKFHFNLKMELEKIPVPETIKSEVVNDKNRETPDIAKESIVDSDSIEPVNENILKDKKILLVEDNQFNVFVMQQFLDQWDIDHDAAENGEKAVEKASQKQYDMILMDLQMPVMDGYEATREIRKLDNPAYKKIPILALTAAVLKEVKEEVFEAGMNDFVSKPINPDDLKEKMGKYFS